MNIGFIAMSGIRACDEELLRLGLTLPGFVERSKAIASLPSLGLLTLAAMCGDDHRITYLEVQDIRQNPHLPVNFDLVAISTFTAQANEAYELAQRYRRDGIPVVMGGLHVTSVPDEPAQHGIVAAVGEGEVIWPRILADAERHVLQSRYDARGVEFDMAAAPMPAYELLDIEKYNRLTVQTSRGCPWRCSFCASSVLLTGRYKQKPAGLVLREIDKIRSLWRRPFVEFADDNAFVNKSWWRDFLPDLYGRHVKWFAETDLSICDDSDLLCVMRDSGCAEVLIGFESPILAGLDGIELRRNWKKRQWPRYKDAIHRIQSHGIRVNACFVLGLDGHTTEIFDEVFNFVEDAAPFDVQVTVQTPFPGTPLHHMLRRQNRLVRQQWERCTLFDVNYRPSHMSISELEDGLRKLVVRLYSDSFTSFRREQFKRQWVHRPAHV